MSGGRKGAGLQGTHQSPTRESVGFKHGPSPEYTHPSSQMPVWSTSAYFPSFSLPTSPTSDPREQNPQETLPVMGRRHEKQSGKSRPYHIPASCPQVTWAQGLERP